MLLPLIQKRFSSLTNSQAFRKGIPGCAWSGNNGGLIIGMSTIVKEHRCPPIVYVRVFVSWRAG